MKLPLAYVVVPLLLAILGCGEPERSAGDGASNRNSGTVPISEMLGEADSDAVSEEDEEGIEAGIAATTSAEEAHPAEVPTPGETTSDVASVVPSPEYDAGESDAAKQPTEAAAPRSIRVATWHPPDVDVPEWIHPAIRRVQGARRMFGHYNGNYKRYTADVIREIRRVYPEGESVTLILQHWIQRGWTGGSPAGIDPHGLFTHRHDRTKAGLPGIWPDAGARYWLEANHHLFSELRQAGIDVAMVALDTEVQAVTGPFAFEGTHEAIFADPRWEQTPLRGFDGKTAADLWPGFELGTRESREWFRMIGLHSFAHAVNEVLTDVVLEFYPDALISDFRWHDAWRSPTPSPGAGHMLRVRARVIAHIMDVMGIEDRWLQRGVGNAASPALYGTAHAGGNLDDDGNVIPTIEYMLMQAEQLIGQYGDPDLVVPWITDRRRMNQRIRDEDITVERYHEFIRALVDLGINRFLWFPAGQDDAIAPQQSTVRAFKAAVRGTGDLD